MKPSSLLNSMVPDILIKAMVFDKSYSPVRIKECGEPLVNFKQYADSQDLPVVIMQRSPFTNKKLFPFIRDGLVKPLRKAITEFHEKGYILKIEFMYRTYMDQQKAYMQSLKKVKSKYPKLALQVQKNLAGIYVAATPNTSAHLSGAALDVTLLDQRKNLVDMGSSYLCFGEESATAYNKISNKARKNREFLVKVMEKNGFANYPYEFWHFSMGDKIAAFIQNRKYAKYGPIMPDPKFPKVKPVKNGDAYFY